jgi:hypothetical protein
MSRTIEVLVRLTIDEDADIPEMVAEMDYEFTHTAIEDTEIIDVYYE